MYELVCDIINTLGDARVVVNGDKLQDCKKNVLFAGFKISGMGFELDNKMFKKV